MLLASLKSGLSQDGLDNDGGDVSGMVGNGHLTGLGRMDILVVRALHTLELPSVRQDDLFDFPELHTLISSGILYA